MKCNQGDHRDGRDEVTARVRYVNGNRQCWTVDMCARHAGIAAGNLARAGRREVATVPAGWTPVIVGTESHEFVGKGARCVGVLGFAAGHPLHNEVCGHTRDKPIHARPECTHGADCRVHPDANMPHNYDGRKVRPGRITDGMAEAFARAAGTHEEQREMVRKGLAAALVRREVERVTTPELHPVNLDPYPATVSEVADEIARFVVELHESGAAAHLVDRLFDRLADWRSGRDEGIAEQESNRDPEDIF